MLGIHKTPNHEAYLGKEGGHVAASQSLEQKGDTRLPYTPGSLLLLPSGEGRDGGDLIPGSQWITRRLKTLSNPGP